MASAEAVGLQNPKNPFCQVAKTTRHENYRGELLIAVKNFLDLLPLAQDADQTRQIEQTLCMVLTHQLDWSLDDLELDREVRQVVDGILAEPAPDFEIVL